MKKFFALSFMILSMVIFVSCGSKSDKKETPGKDNGKTGAEQTDDSDAGITSDDSDKTDTAADEDYTVDENIFEVPADQDNTVGAPCDPKTFVEFCDGNAYVECSEEYDGYDEATDEAKYKYVVQKYECSEEYPICLTYRRNDEGWEHNWAVCFSTCEKAGKTSECSSVEDGYYFWYTEFICKQTSKGILKFTGEEKPCNSGCSEDGKTCEIKKCDPKKDKTYCDENNVLHECSDYEEEVYYQAVYFCGALKGRICGYDEEFEEFGCFPDPYFVDEDLVEVPKNQNNTENAPCDPDAFIQFCDGDTIVYCGYDGEKDIVVRTKCDEQTPICLTYAEDNGGRYNISSCFASCENEDTGEGGSCTTSDNGYNFSYKKYRCLATSKGKLKFPDETIPCDSACSEDGKTCEIKECDPSADEAYCDEKGVLHECEGWTGFEAASFCEKWEGMNMVCAYSDDEERFACTSK